MDDLKKVVVRRAMNWTWPKILAWCLPLAILAGAVVIISIFANKDVITLLVSVAAASGGTYAVASRKS